MNLKTMIKIGFTVVTICIIGVSFTKLSAAYKAYQQEARLHQKFMEYRPTASPDASVKQDGTKGDGKRAVVNQSILDLKKKENKDIAGWITIPGTQIDYPFVYAKDYKEYLRTDLNGDYSIAGTVFLDYRSGQEFDQFDTILYGHNMKNGSMFGDLLQYRDRKFYRQHTGGTVYLPYATLKLQLVSCLVVKSVDSNIYGVMDTDIKQRTFIETIQKDCVHGSEMVPADLKATDRFVILSTCSYDYSEARTVVVYRIVPGGEGQEDEDTDNHM